MQDGPINKNLLITLIVVVAAGAIYMAVVFFSGGFNTGDIPEYVPPSGAPAQPAPAVEQTQPQPPAAGPGGPAAPGLGTPIPGGGPAPGGPTPGTPGGEAPSLPGGAPAGEEPPVAYTEEEKMDELAAFEQIDSRGILYERLAEARENETKVNADEDLPYPDTGRIDPLMIVSSAIPEELRPPRTGETDWDSVLEYLIAEEGTAIIDAINITVWSVMEIGMETWVNIEIEAPFLANPVLGSMPEGQSIRLNYMSYGTPQTLTITCTSASPKVVTFSMSAGGASKSKTYIPKG
jgi:hypothetical protein